MDPSERYKHKNVITLGLIPGPIKPKDLMSFLDSIYDEIKQLGSRGLEVRKNGEVVHSGKVHLISNTGDIPGIADLMNHKGHMCEYRCRICEIQGVYACHGYRFNGVARPRTTEDLINGRSDLDMPGVSRIITSLVIFSGVRFFVMDEMHRIGGGLSKLIYIFLNPDRNKLYKRAQGYCFDTTLLPANQTVMGNFGKYIKLSRATIPPSFESCWDDCFHLYRLVNLEGFFAYVVPCVALDYVVNSTSRKMLMKLVNGCNKSMACVITREEVAIIKR